MCQNYFKNECLYILNVYQFIKYKVTSKEVVYPEKVWVCMRNVEMHEILRVKCKNMQMSKTQVQCVRIDMLDTTKELKNKAILQYCMHCYVVHSSDCVIFNCGIPFILWLNMYHAHIFKGIFVFYCLIPWSLHYEPW